MPAGRYVRHLSNRWIKLLHITKANQRGIFSLRVFPTQKLPAMVFEIMGYMQNRRTIMDNALQGEDPTVRRLIPGPFVGQSSVCFQDWR